MPPSEQHRKRLKEAVAELKREGWKVVTTEHKVPDAIAVKDGKVVAVEVLAQSHRKGKGWRLDGGFTFRQKRLEYSMFDEVLFYTFHRAKAKRGRKP